MRDATLPLCFGGVVVGRAHWRLGTQVKAAGLGAGYTPVGWIQNSLEAFTVSTGLPWMVGIIGLTVVLRTALLPVVVTSMRNGIALGNLKPEIEL